MLGSTVLGNKENGQKNKELQLINSLKLVDAADGNKTAETKNLYF